MTTTHRFSLQFALAGALLFGGLLPVQAQDESHQPREIEVPAATIEERGNHLEVRVGRSVYKVLNPTGDERLAYESMSAEDQRLFDENREHNLKAIARALQSLKYGFGIGSLTGSGIKYTYQSVKSLFAKKATNEELQVIEKADAHVRQTLRERSEAIVNRMLNAVDRSIWTQAPLFARSSEFGLMTSVGVEMLGGVDGGKYSFGGLYDLGISLGINKDTKAVVFQIFRDRETFKGTMMKWVFVAGALGKAGFYVSANSKELHRQGTSFYPPLVPGFSSKTTNSFMTGLSSGLTIPPSPIGDLLTYTNYLDQKTILRISVSPMLKGFVRVETGLGASLSRYFIEPIRRSYNYFRVGAAVSCSAIFAH